jgi:diguanylate cyclase (GGDEF)-like protein
MGSSFLIKADLLKDARNRALKVFLWALGLGTAVLSLGLTLNLVVEDSREVRDHALEIRSMVATVFRLEQVDRYRLYGLLSRYRQQHNNDLQDGINYILVVDRSGQIALSSRRAWDRLSLSDPLLSRTESDDPAFRSIQDCFSRQAPAPSWGTSSCFKEYSGFYLPTSESYTIGLPVSVLGDQVGSLSANYLVVVNFDPSIASGQFLVRIGFIVASVLFAILFFLSVLAFFLYRSLLPALKAFAEVDDLTGLTNRKACMDLGIRLLARAEREQLPCVIGILDLDNFKSINDTYGHQCGDFVLRAVSTALADSIHEGDLLARLGGEEFLVMAQCSSAHGQMVMERLRTEVERISPQWQGRSVKVTLSIGLASTEQFGYNLNHLYSQADSALYRAKQQGRNRTCWSSAGQLDAMLDPWSPGAVWTSSFGRMQPMDSGPSQ